ncbi:MAG: type II CAAX prenyl endopeptidase Rce1 family protein [Aulosira sp. ZfuVER01]|nr:CPBP family glutamic-type intramembrane protease [Aulosira sp. ZfuVER01]MDZ8001157.1 CPBP family glutamic-type intramembrane protease [Aulosira sp. DedVER01a]MDZ8053139.1 CPBP family glutamic-type intramembrane protease [Aulosira sp. ZfuCHP01]
MRNNLNKLLNLNIIHRLKKSISTIPDTDFWLNTVVRLLLIYTLISLPLGLYFGFLQFGFSKLTLEEIIKILAICLLTPAITEEMFFRVLLLPHITEDVSRTKKWIWGCISLVIFIVYHPLNALTAYPAGFPTFMNPVFLLQATLLGIICTIAYFQSGSLWPSVVMHWIIVVVWLVFFGGYERLNT